MQTYEWSGTCNLAALCGVLVILLVAPCYEKFAITDASIRDMGALVSVLMTMSKN